MKKTIGICATKINDEFSRNFISLIHEAASSEEYPTAVFHSVFDFYDRNVETGARTIFDMLPFSELCAVIILRDSLFDKQILDGIINSSRENGVPVIMARGADKRCISVTGSFEKAYADLLNSVIRDQGIKDTVYIAGRKTDDPDSENRIAVYKKVLLENGCEFDPENVEYGEYWEAPTVRAVNRILDKRGKAAGQILSPGQELPPGQTNPPGAIFCANDIMAFTVMEKLRENGIRVPEDTVVTGFDGLESSKYCSPSLSSCCEDTESLVSAVFSAIKKLSLGESVPETLHYNYRAAIRQSSEKSRKVPLEEMDTQLFFRMRADEINERNYNNWLDSVISVLSVENLRRVIPVMAGGDYSVGIRADAFLSESSAANAEHPSEYLIIRRSENGGTTDSFSPASQLTKELLSLPRGSKTAFFSMISNRDFVYGLAFTPTADIQNDAPKINRYIRTLNRGLYVALCGEKLRKSAGEPYQKKYIDALTGTLNIDGANKWFADTVVNDFTRNTQLSVGVFSFINYQQVLDRYGLHILEENMQYIAKSLKLANPENAVISRISADTFAVLLLHSPDADLGAMIDKAISLFYGSLDIKTKNSEIEVSCGYHDAATPWQGKLSDYLNAATSSLYRNRVSFDKHLPKNIDMSDSTKMLEYRASFMTLLNNNLFTYHFQPIVDARTGEIAAYEALMRTKGDVVMSPLDVLSAATLFSKLDMVEFMSFMNIFGRLSEEREKFGSRSVFINTIPGHFLDDEHCDIVAQKYGDLLSQSVIEITESETITIDELDAIRTFGGNKEKLRIAVDDYGTGHSNIVNLIEYKPQIVKIDRYLITNIQNDKNKQMFVKSIIEFSEENDIKVLAEGVETLEEMQTVIDYGVDYIQGYYTAKPSAEILQELPPEIKRQITERASAKKDK